MQKPFGMAALAACALLAVQSSRADDLKTVIAKTNAVYKGMKSAQMSLQTAMSAGPKGSATINTDVKAIGDSKANINIQPQGGGSGAMGQSLAGRNMHIYDDGKTSYMFMSKTNQFVKQAHSPGAFYGVAAGYGLPYAGMNPKAEHYKLLAPAQFNGKAAYVLEFTPPQAGNTKILLYIDQATYHIKQSKILRSDGKISASMVTTVKSETLNAPIPDSVFAFTPPKGATQVTPQQRPNPPAGVKGGKR